MQQNTNYKYYANKIVKNARANQAVKEVKRLALVAEHCRSTCTQCHKTQRTKGIKVCTLCLFS